MTPSEIQAQIDALEEKMAAVGHIRSDSFADRQQTFRDLSEMREQIAYWKRMLAGSRTRYAATSKGV